MGAAVPRRDFEAVVHSVFGEAANLRLDEAACLLTLLSAGGTDLPQGIRLRTPPEYSFKNTLKVGEKVICRNGLLKVEPDRLSIDLRGAGRWRCRLPWIDLNDPRVVRASRAVQAALVERQKRTGGEPLTLAGLASASPNQGFVYAQALQKHLRRLIQAARRLEPPPEAVVAGLIGLGPGLTPAGDDLLVGFLTGLHCTSGMDEARRAFCQDLGKTIVQLSPRTNDISRTYLVCAARSQVSGALLALADAIAKGMEPAGLLPVAEAAMRVGHSSGMETVGGFLSGLSAWWKGS